MMTVQDLGMGRAALRDPLRAGAGAAGGLKTGPGPRSRGWAASGRRTGKQISPWSLRKGANALVYPGDGETPDLPRVSWHRGRAGGRARSCPRLQGGNGKPCVSSCLGLVCPFWKNPRHSPPWAHVAGAGALGLPLGRDQLRGNRRFTLSAASLPGTGESLSGTVAFGKRSRDE